MKRHWIISSGSKNKAMYDISTIRAVCYKFEEKVVEIHYKNTGTAWDQITNVSQEDFAKIEKQLLDAKEIR